MRRWPEGEAGESVTGREEEASRLMARWYGNREIAARLSASVRTVEAHKTNGTRKPRLAGRGDLVGYAIFRGWMRNA